MATCQQAENNIYRYHVSTVGTHSRMPHWAGKMRPKWIQALLHVSYFYLYFYRYTMVNEPGHSTSYKIACAPKDTRHPNQSLCCLPEYAFAWLPAEPIVKTVIRLHIWVFAGAHAILMEMLYLRLHVNNYCMNMSNVPALSAYYVQHLTLSYICFQTEILQSSLSEQGKWRQALLQSEENRSNI